MTSPYLHTCYRPGEKSCVGCNPPAELREVPVPRKRLKVEPEPGGRLEQLLIENKRAHDDMEEAKEREAETKLAIKKFLLDLFEKPEDMPDAFDIAGDAHGRYPGYSLTHKGVGAYRLNMDAFKAGEPMTYVQYAVPVTPTWELREATQGRRHRG